MPRYEFSSMYLSELPTEKVGVSCKSCGMTRQYDRLALLERGGDHPLPSLLKRVAIAEGCEIALKDVPSPRCQLVYSPHYEETPAEIEERNRKRRRFR